MVAIRAALTLTAALAIALAVPALARAADATPPEITPIVTGPSGDAGWFRGNVTVVWRLVDLESPITATTGCATVIVSQDTAGIALTCRATSGGGTRSVTLTVRKDATPPAGTCEPRPVFVLGKADAVAAVVTDPVSGPVSPMSALPVDVYAAGARTVSLPLRDRAGNTATVSCPYLVVYRLLGFFVQLPPRHAEPGQRLTVAFALADHWRRRIPDSDAATLAADCAATVTVSTGARGCARYDAATRSFRFTFRAGSPGRITIAAEVTQAGDVLARKRLFVRVR